MNTQEQPAGAGPVHQTVRPRFCGDCKHCGTQWDNGPSIRGCAAAPARREAHFAERGNTPDAHFTAPMSWVYVNSSMAERCRWFVAA